MIAGSYWSARNVSIPFLHLFIDSGEGPPCYKRWQNLVAETYRDADFVSYSPMCMCIWLGLNDLARDLIRLLPTVDHSFENGLTCLAAAAQEDNVHITHYLLQNGADADKPSSEPEDPRAMTPLHFAIENYASEVVEVLLKHGVDLHIPSASGATPFYRACRSGDLYIVKRLKEYGCDINVRTWDNWTPIIEAIGNGHGEVVDHLIEWGADLLVVTDDDLTPLSLARNLCQISTAEKLQRAITNMEQRLPVSLLLT
jgi:amino acid transporter